MADFLHVNNSFAGYNYPVEEAAVIVLGIPFSSSSISETSQYGPTMVRESLKMIEGLDEKSGKDFTKIKICDLGNVEIVPGSYELTAERVRETIAEIKSVNSKAFLLILGGDHLSILPAVEALHPDTIIDLDAHRDLKNEYLGNKFSHSSWARRALENLKCDMIQIGTREVSEEELEAEKKFLVKKGIEHIKNARGPIYVSIDMDVFDPCYVETGFPVSNGLHPRDVFEILEMLKGKNVIAMDINEISSRTLPSKTGFLAAEVIRKALANL